MIPTVGWMNTLTTLIMILVSKKGDSAMLTYTIEEIYAFWVVSASSDSEVLGVATWKSLLEWA